ncbi:hypothetical protein Tco_1292149 [Tanacetum coccineum]
MEIKWGLSRSKHKNNRILQTQEILSKQIQEEERKELNKKDVIASIIICGEGQKASNVLSLQIKRGVTTAVSCSLEGVVLSLFLGVSKNEDTYDDCDLGVRPEAVGVKVTSWECKFSVSKDDQSLYSIIFKFIGNQSLFAEAITNDAQNKDFDESNVVNEMRFILSPLGFEDFLIIQTKSIRTIKPAAIPIEAHKALGKDKEGEDVGVHLYRSMIGCLMYLTASRPDIMFAVYPTSGDVHILEERLDLLAVQETNNRGLSHSTEAEYVQLQVCCGQLFLCYYGDSGLDLNEIQSEKDGIRSTVYSRWSNITIEEDVL